jgi:hypothetical protein
MEGTSFWLIGACVAAALVVICRVVGKPLFAARRRAEVDRAVRAFRGQREQLEAKFTDLAAVLANSRGLRCRVCDWQDGVSFARDLNSGLLTAFVGVNVHVETVEGDEIDAAEAVGTVREAAAVFHYERGRWATGGRALFNMSPDDALTRLEGRFEPVQAIDSSSWRNSL